MPRSAHRVAPVAGLAFFASLAGACAAEVDPSGQPTGVAGAAIAAGAVVVNECATGSSGWIELYNATASAQDLAADPATCFFVDDEDGGGAPRVITDGDVQHVAASTTCAAASRPATCGLLAPGEYVWVKDAYVNSKTPDACRLLSGARTAGACGGASAVVDPGGPTASTAAGQCFGRQPTAGAWVPTATTCTPGAANAAGASLVQVGTGATLLRGVVVTPQGPLSGEVLVVGNTITCVAASCAGQPGAATASIVATAGVVLPGLIDAHNHILFDTFDATDWAPTKTYTNHNQWPNDPRYKAMVDAKQWLNGETSGSPVSLGCEMDKYGELKELIAGTTSVIGAANPADKACYGSLARTIDQKPNGLATDTMQVSTLFPSTSSADAVCKNLSSSATTAYVIHDGEGVDASALGEFAKLGTITTTDGCLYAPQTTIVHGTAFGGAQFSTMAAAGMSLVWSPRSNVFLYGAGTDLTKTANVPLARSLGVNVALGPDWSIGGSQNMLDELRFADEVDDAVWGNVLSSQDLFEMATIDAARALHLDAEIGSIEVGKRADLFVVGGDVTRPYDALLAATPADVRLVMVDGVALYGDAQLEALGPAAPGCEPFGACGASKFLCMAKAGGKVADKLGQTLEDVAGAITSALAQYDALDLTPYDFSPITPVVTCGR